VTPAVGSRFDFDALADSYDHWYADPAGALYDSLERRAVGTLLPAACRGSRLLEVGSGTGHWSRFFVENGFDVVGFDVSARMVEVASAKRIPDATFLVADGGEIPFADGSFDVVAAVTTLEFAGSMDRVLGEMARCARPGGWLVIGALNRNSILGLRRRLSSSRLFSTACFPTVGSLRKRLARYGNPEIRSAAFAWPRFASPVLEWIGHKARLPWGDFLVAVCRIEG
jgi:ubiquinone/menaquinone biosynthesis C-methylase UbiE